MTKHDRRTVLRAAGTAVGVAGLGAGTVAGATGADSRFLIDLRAVPRSAVPDDLEIVHDLSEIDLLAARGNASRVGGSDATTPDVTVDWSGDGGAVRERPGPRADENGASHNHDGPPKNVEYQWDKRAQDAGDYTDKPGGGKTVHDATTGEGTRVAVVDTGVASDHPDLDGVVNEELSANFTTDDGDFRPNGAGDHGTHVAGIVAGTNSNDGPAGGILGTAPDTEIVSLRVFSGAESHQSDSLAAFLYAAEVGCDVANFSAGYPPVDPAEAEGWDPAFLGECYRRAVEAAREKGTSIVNSAGNEGVDLTPDDVLSLPTEVEGVFVVSATGPIGVGWGDKHSENEEKWLTGNRLAEPTTEPAFYTNYGSPVDVSAAGGNADLEALEDGVPGAANDLVYSTIVSDDGGDAAPGYGWKAGTSMAAPQVAAAIALVRSLRPDASVEAVEHLVRETASASEGGERYHGAGHLDLERLVEAAR